MRPVPMADQGAWLADRVTGWGRVASVAGGGFDAYVRLLHPVGHYRGAAAVQPEEERWTRRWADVAAEAGKQMHPLVQWGKLRQPQSPFADGSEVGWLDPEILAALTPLLREATTTPDALIAGFWNGWGGAEIVSPATLEIPPGRHFDLLETTLDELSDPNWGYAPDVGWHPGFRFPSVQLLWPVDHRWILASDIDWDSTIIAGGRTLVDALLADPRFETFEVSADDDLSWDGDTMN